MQKILKVYKTEIKTIILNQILNYLRFAMMKKLKINRLYTKRKAKLLLNNNMRKKMENSKKMEINKLLLILKIRKILRILNILKIQKNYLRINKCKRNLMRKKDKIEFDN